MNKTGAPLLTRSYHIPLAMFDDAFRAFQKKYVYPMNILFTVILLAIAGVYVHAAVKDNTQTMAYLLIVICIALILVRWYRVFKLRRAVHDALKEIESDTYELKVYEGGMTILAKDAEEQPFELTEEPEAQPEQISQPEEADGENGFRQVFDEKPAVHGEPLKPTEIEFDKYVKTYEYPEFFMIYLTAAKNFYVIPKKEFSDAELAQLRDILQNHQNG